MNEQLNITSLKPVKGSLRQLPIRSAEFQNQIIYFKQWLRVFGFADSTVYYSPVYVRSFFHFLEGSGIQQVSQISNNHIKLYINHLDGRMSYRTGRKLSMNYILNHLNSIKLFSRYLINSTGTFIDSKYRFSNSDKGTRRWLIQNDIKKLYDKCVIGKHGDINRAILGFYYGMGLRRMEEIGIDISDIQWNNGVIYVKHAKLMQERYVPMNPAVQRDLEIYNYRYRIPLLRKQGLMNEPAFLISQQGSRLTGNAAYSRIQNLARKAGLVIPLSWHSLRHSIATHLLENGLLLENISQFLGHRSLESTQIYTHLIHNTIKS